MKRPVLKHYLANLKLVLKETYTGKIYREFWSECTDYWKSHGDSILGFLLCTFIILTAPLLFPIYAAILTWSER